MTQTTAQQTLVLKPGESYQPTCQCGWEGPRNINNLATARERQAAHRLSSKNPRCS